MKRYSEMTPFELETELRSLRDRARRAESLGYVNEFEVLMRKMTMAQTYLLDPTDYPPNTTYRIKNSDDFFYMTYLNGMFAWGTRNNGEEEEGIPLALLEK
ncbi:MAG: YfhH family protein [Bacilli bacterium]